MVNQTNLYARQKQQIHPDPRWTPVIVEEMKAWLGLPKVSEIQNSELWKGFRAQWKFLFDRALNFEFHLPLTKVREIQKSEFLWFMTKFSEVQSSEGYEKEKKISYHRFLYAHLKNGTYYVTGYGVRPSVRKLFLFRLTPPTVYIRSSWNLVYS